MNIYLLSEISFSTERLNKPWVDPVLLPFIYKDVFIHIYYNFQN